MFDTVTSTAVLLQKQRPITRLLKAEDITEEVQRH